MNSVLDMLLKLAAKLQKTDETQAVFYFFYVQLKLKTYEYAKNQKCFNSSKKNPSLCGWDYCCLLMLLSEQIVDSLYWVEGTEGDFNEDGRPITHRSIPKTW